MGYAEKKAADEEEAKVRAGTWRDPAAGRITFGEYTNRWYEAQDLAASTMQTYRHQIEGHMLPTFEDKPIADILATDITAWEKRELELGYAVTTVKSRRATLHLILAMRFRMACESPTRRLGAEAGASARDRPGAIAVRRRRSRARSEPC